jgi:integrase
MGRRRHRAPRGRYRGELLPDDGCDEDPKTHQRRRIDLTSELVERLYTWRLKQKQDALRRGLSAPAYVFTTKHGAPRRQDGNMRRIFQRTIAGCQLADLGLTPHSLRDTFATRHLNTDWGKLPWVSRQLGHESERTTSEHYFAFQPSTATRHYADQIAGSRGERPARK